MENEEELEQFMGHMAQDGLLEETTKDRQRAFKLSSAGNRQAQETIAARGLPFLMQIEAKHRPDRFTTIKDVAERLVSTLPKDLEAVARRNFAPFWGEFGNGTREDFLAAMEEAEDGA